MMQHETTEPALAVGLIEGAGEISITLHATFGDVDGSEWPAGNYAVRRQDDSVTVTGPRAIADAGRWHLLPGVATFALVSRVGHQFHWAEDEEQHFAGGLRVECDQEGLRVINDVPLETYLTSVVCSEMAADCPLELIKAHSVISRSWLLAQRAHATTARAPWQENAAGLRWFDQTAHAAFDVCAEDHCQRYHGLNRISSQTVRDAIAQTRGQVLTFDGEVCDARYSKSCGGMVEDARAAWSDEFVPYLVSFFDGPDGAATAEDLTSESGFARFLHEAPAAYCRCDDSSVLQTILPERDRRTTPAFYRWTERVTPHQIQTWLREKRGVDPGRPLALEPVSRGASGRLISLRVVGSEGTLVIGKELEIRRLLSDSHLLSSAFVIETEGSQREPDAFVLRGAGWGHGVGLCQIGAAVMAVKGHDHRAILAHYYPGTRCASDYARVSS